MNICIEAPCKINLHLRVGKKRADGFHPIESIFLLRDLCDTLTFDGSFIKTPCTKDVEINMDCSALPECMRQNLLPENLPPQKNIIYRAVQTFCTMTGLQFCGTINVIKRIPYGAGLGGGSSDAAAALCALRTMHLGENSTDNGAHELNRAAATLGSDVPFFLLPILSGTALASQQTCAYVTGRGEIIEYINAPQLHTVIVHPGFASDTASAYKAFDAWTKSAPPRSLENAVHQHDFFST